MAFASWGTDHVGTGRCKNHGGTTTSQRVSAERQRAQQRMVQYGLPANVQPSEAPLWVVWATAGQAAWLGRKASELGDLTSTDKAPVLIRLYSVERGRLTRASVGALGLRSG
jgi:hypothetical protein